MRHAAPNPGRSSAATRRVPGLVREVRAHLEAHGSREHAAGVQWFFKEEVRSYGWYTADLRAYGRTLHRALSGDPPVLLDVADRLFGGRTLEEKALAVVMLEPSVRPARTRPGTTPRGLPQRFVIDVAELDRFDAWLDRVASWADHDALAMVIIGPLLVAHPAQVRRVLSWAASRNRWRRRAAAVSLIPGIRQGRFVREATRVTRLLLTDDDDMVQKGLGWLLREWGKARPSEVMPLLLDIRSRAPRLVLRTACERLSHEVRRLILARTT